MITIGIPFYNDEKYLDYAIKSVFNQTYTDWKLILISDGGSDSSLSIARSYEGDSRVTVIADGENHKLSYRLNQIAQLSTTKYLARMDADDIMHPERIEKQLKILIDNPSIDVLGTNAFSIDDKNNIQGLRLKIGDEGYHLIDVKSFIHPSIMAKTEWFLKNPYKLQAVRMEDAELWYRTRENNIFKVYTEPLLFYREFDNEYYKKYFKSYKPMFLLAKQTNDWFWVKAGVYQLTVGIIYYIFNLLNLSEKLINRRRHIVSNELFKEGKLLLDVFNK